MVAGGAPGAGTRSLREGMFQLFRFNVLAFLMRLVSSAVVARVMGPAAMGVWLLLSLLPSYAEGLARLKTDLAAVYVLGLGKWSLGEVALALNVIALITGGMCFVGLLIGRPWITPWLFGAQGVDPRLYGLMMLTIPVHFLAMGYAYLLLQMEDVTAYNLQNFMRTVLPGTAAAVLLLTTDMRISALVLSLLAGGVLGLACGMWLIHRREGLKRARTPGLYGALLSVGRRLYLAGMIEYLNQYLGSLLVGLHLATRELAFFRLGQDRVGILDQIPSAVNSLLYPRIARTSAAEEQVELAAKCMRTLLIILGGSAVVGSIAAPAAVWILYGHDYFPMTWSIWIFLPGVCLLGITSPATQYFMGCGRADIVWKLALVPLAAQLLLLVPLIRLAGFQGAALCISASFIAYAIARVLVLARVTRRSPAALIVPTAADWRLVRTFLRERSKPYLDFVSRAARAVSLHGR